MNAALSNPFMSGKRRPIAVGHRGVPARHQENTLAGFKRAVQLGVPAIELDVQLTQDRKAVVLHDSHLRRLTGSPRNVKVKGDHRREYAWFVLGDSLPVMSMSAERAARKILAACRRGDAEIIVGFPYQIASRFHGLFPGTTIRLLSWVNRILPHENNRETRRGKECESVVTRSGLTALNDRAAHRNNEHAIDEKRTA